jgi:hypothetical protein
VGVTSVERGCDAGDGSDEEQYQERGGDGSPAAPDLLAAPGDAFDRWPLGDRELAEGLQALRHFDVHGVFSVRS